MDREFHSLADHNQRQKDKNEIRSKLRAGLNEVIEEMAMDMAKGNEPEVDLPEIEVGDHRFTVSLKANRWS